MTGGEGTAPVGRFDWERAVLDSELPPSARLVALVVGSHTRHGRCYLKADTIAAECGWSSRTPVHQWTGLLREAGWLTWLRGSPGRDGRGGIANTYALQYPDDQRPPDRTLKRSEQRPAAGSLQRSNDHPQPDERPRPRTPTPTEQKTPTSTRRTDAAGHHEDHSNQEEDDLMEVADLLRPRLNEDDLDRLRAASQREKDAVRKAVSDQLAAGWSPAGLARQVDVAGMATARSISAVLATRIRDTGGPEHDPALADAERRQAEFEAVAERRRQLEEQRAADEERLRPHRQRWDRLSSTQRTALAHQVASHSPYVRELLAHDPSGGMYLETAVIAHVATHGWPDDPPG